MTLVSVKEEGVMQGQHWETTSTTSSPCRDLTAEKLLQFLAGILGLQEYSKRLRTEINITKSKKDIMKPLKLSGCLKLRKYNRGKILGLKKMAQAPWGPE